MFLSYAPADDASARGVEKHLARARARPGVIGPVAFAADGGRRRLSQGGGPSTSRLAHVVVLLVSADYFASDFLYDHEMTPSLARHRSGEARVVPVLVSAHDAETAPFSDLERPAARNKLPGHELG